jgi:hypothetical protein
MQRYVFEEEAEPKYLVISLIWKDTEMPDETVIQQDLKPLQAELADVLDWDTAQFNHQTSSHSYLISNMALFDMLLCGWVHYTQNEQ